MAVPQVALRPRVFDIDSPSREESGREQNVALGYLRILTVLLVVAAHAVLAYHPLPPGPATSLTVVPRWWQAFPIVDARRWVGFAPFSLLIDNFSMSLMFFVSGLFVWSSLRRKGIRIFLRDRLLRLGLPFLIAALVIAPLTFYATYLCTGENGGLTGFLGEYWQVGNWPGPQWFIWVLLAFDVGAAVLFWLLHDKMQTASHTGAFIFQRPALCFTLALAGSAAVFLPMAALYSPASWTNFGPFNFQTSRFFLYFLYFMLGVAIGGYGLDRSFMAKGGKLGRRWPLWLLGAVTSYFVTLVVVASIGLVPHKTKGLEILAEGAWLLSCAAIIFASVAMAVRFVHTRRRILDSLSGASYGIYLVHFMFVAWLQYALLKRSISAQGKGLLVFLGASALSWSLVVLVRRFAAVKQVI